MVYYQGAFGPGPATHSAEVATMRATRVSSTAGSDPKASVEAINAELFRALGHPVRVRVLELLRAREEMSVRDLQATLQTESGGASQHLSAMRRQGLLATRRQGTSVFYRVRDRRTFQLLDVASQVLASQYEYTRTLIAGLNDIHRPQATRPPRGLTTASPLSSGEQREVSL